MNAVAYDRIVLMNDHKTLKFSCRDFKSLHCAFQQPAYLFIVVDVFVGHAGEKLFEVLPLVALPALPVCLQVSVETLYFVLAFLYLHWHLRRHRENYSYGGLQGT